MNWLHFIKIHNKSLEFKICLIFTEIFWRSSGYFEWIDMHFIKLKTSWTGKIYIVSMSCEITSNLKKLRQHEFTKWESGNVLLTAAWTYCNNSSFKSGIFFKLTSVIITIYWKPTRILLTCKFAIRLPRTKYVSSSKMKLYSSS